MSRNESVHPVPENILRYVDGELSARDAEHVKQHLEACWQCRAEKEEIEHAAAECIRYRKVEASLLPEVPQPWFDIRREFTLLESAPAPSLAERLSGFVSSLLTTPMRLAPTGMALLAIGWMTYSFRYAPAAPAAALLDRATSSRPAKSIKPRRIRISTPNRQFTRLLAPQAVPVAAMQQDDELKALFLAAHYNWDDPLSAVSFRDWRNHLTSKTDTVSTTDTRYEITTSTEDGALASAMLSLDTSDLHAIATRFEFRGRDAVSIVELPEEPAGIAANTLPILPAPGTGSPATPLQTAELAKPEAVINASAHDELQVFLRLRRMGADLGEPIEIQRTERSVIVRAAGLAASRQLELKNVLADLPRVSVDLTEAPTSPASVVSSSSTTVRAGASPTQDRIQQFVGGRPAFERLASQVLDASDRAMARAHALRRLAERFPAQAEASMDLTGREQLATLHREHTAVLEREAESLRAAIGPVLTALGAADPVLTVTVPATWQEGALRIFESSLKLDRQLSATLGASSAQGGDPAEVFTELVRLNGLLQAYHQK